MPRDFLGTHVNKSEKLITLGVLDVHTRVYDPTMGL